MPIRYYLQPNPVTPDPNDQSARVETLGNLTPEDLAQELVNRGVATSRAQAAAVIAGYESLIAERVADGFAVNTPLFTLRPGINGVFADPTATFDEALHTITGNLQPGPLLREKLLTATPQKILRAEAAPVLTAFINKTTGGVNATATPGGIGQIPGEQLKFDPAKTADGIYFVPGTGSAVKVPTTSLATRTEGELLFTVPALTAGSYHIEVRRTYGTGANTQVRVGQLGAAITVA